MKRIILYTLITLTLGLYGMSFPHIYATPLPQIPAIELPCPVGTSVIGGIGQVINSSTGQLRQWLCVDANGNITLQGTSGVGVTTTGSPASLQLAMFSGGSTITGTPTWTFNGLGPNNTLITVGGATGWEYIRSSDSTPVGLMWELRRHDNTGDVAALSNSGALTASSLTTTGSGYSNLASQIDSVGGAGDFWRNADSWCWRTTVPATVCAVPSSMSGNCTVTRAGVISCTYSMAASPSNAISPVASTNYCVGFGPGGTFNTTLNFDQCQFVVPVAMTITSLTVRTGNFITGSAGTVTISIMKNGANCAGSGPTVTQTWNSNAPQTSTDSVHNCVYAQGDTYGIEVQTPAWATPPTGVVIHFAVLYTMP